MSERKAVTKTILDELCALALRHRDHARMALRQALLPRQVKPRPPRAPFYGDDVIEALRFCWASP